MLCSTSTTTRIRFISTTKRLLTAPLSSLLRFFSISTTLPNKPIIHKPLFTTLTPSLYFTLRRTDHTMASSASASNPQSIHDFTVKVISYI